MIFILSIYKKQLDAIEKAYAALKEIAENDGKVLFVGTKKTSSRSS